nr:hypothetical protein [uncultured Fusobacterium sp.]
MVKKLHLVAISQTFFDLCCFDKELLNNYNQGSPYLIILKLKYKNKMIDFALPLRSNISKTVKKENYFKLPNNKKTKIGNHHGIHFEKMFPIKNEYKIKFRKDEFLEKIIVPFILLHFKELVEQAQEYLNRYENGIRTDYSTDIEEILKKLDIEIE